jgi:hypothetical protein
VYAALTRPRTWSLTRCWRRLSVSTTTLPSERCPRRFVLRRATLVDDGGDHVCVSGAVVAAHGAGDFEPLRLSCAVGWQAGHTTKERPEPRS